MSTLLAVEGGVVTGLTAVAPPLGVIAGVGVSFANSIFPPGTFKVVYQGGGSVQNGVFSFDSNVPFGFVLVYPGSNANIVPSPYGPHYTPSLSWFADPTSPGFIVNTAILPHTVAQLKSNLTNTLQNAVISGTPIPPTPVAVPSTSGTIIGAVGNYVSATQSAGVAGLLATQQNLTGGSSLLLPVAGAAAYALT